MGWSWRIYIYLGLMVYGWLLKIFSLIRILLLKDKEWQEITHLMGHFSICFLTWTTAENKWGKHITNLGIHLNVFLLRDFFKHWVVSAIISISEYALHCLLHCYFCHFVCSGFKCYRFVRRSFLLWKKNQTKTKVQVYHLFY